MTVKTKTIKNNQFLLGLGAAFLLTLIIIAVGLAYLWNGLERYEAGTPEAALRRYVELLEERNYDALYAASGFHPDSFNCKEDYLAYLERTFEGGLTAAVFVKKLPEEADFKEYNVYLNQKLVGAVELVPSAEASGPAWAARARVSYRKPFTVTAPAHVEVLLNGEALPPESARMQETPPKRLSGVQPPELAPRLLCYKVGELLNPPLITARKPDGTPCAVAEEGEGFAVAAPVSAAAESERKALMEQAAKTYAAFITRDATLAALKEYLYDKTEFYSAIQGFSNIWYVTHDSFEYRNVAVSELTELSPEEFTGRISFDYVVKAGGQEHVYPSSYQLSFLQIEGVWKLANLITL